MSSRAKTCPVFMRSQRVIHERYVNTDNLHLAPSHINSKAIAFSERVLGVEFLPTIVVKPSVE